MDHWSWDAVFYHIYPLGYCGAPERNDLSSTPVPRLDRVTERLGSIAELGVTALYLGPVFESSTHGYDTVDYGQVDRRLGDRGALERLVAEAHRLGIRVVLDAVFNHVGREHPWFASVRSLGASSPEVARFENLRFGERSPYGDEFMYEGWGGHLSLAKLNLRDRPTAEALVDAARSWIGRYDIDGLRLDAADCVDLGFQDELASACRAAKPGFWLLGEVVHGDYRRWAGRGPLDSVTNYECWKGLWSSLNDANYHEIAFALARQFGSEGIYRDVPLYAFADNHDVDRAASLLRAPVHLYPLYCLLFTMPGVPSIYYGSEFGAAGRRARGTDAPLRPPIDEVERNPPHPDLRPAIRRLAGLRRDLEALRRGSYRELRVAPRQLAFERRLADGRRAIVALNASARWERIRIPLDPPAPGLRDALNGGERIEGGESAQLDLPPTWARVLVPA